MNYKNVTPRHFMTFYAVLAMLATGISWAATADNKNVENAPKIISSHAIAMHGDIKYPANFKHFDYASPKALKGGVLRLQGLGTFDSFNPFITRGTPASRIGLLYDTLTTHSADEPFTMYGLVAERIEYPDDRSWAIYHINPKAYFHDGIAMTADDVVFSFNTLIEKGSPLYSQYYADVIEVKALDKQRVKFTFRNDQNKELALIVGQLPVLPAHYWKDREFDRTSLEKPLGSGPYRILSFDAGRSITYERVNNYWAKDLPVNVGHYNFDEIRVDYYRDDTVAVEAFKAGLIDFRWERSASVWHNSYDIPAAAQGNILKQEIRDYSPRGMQAFVLNLRRPPFDNLKFRLAMNYAFDFEWTNRNFFYGRYNRSNSFFSNSELAANGLPSERELEILEPFRDQLPESVFTTPYSNPISDGSGSNRENLRKAQQLLKEAGYEVMGGKLFDVKNKQPVVIQFLTYSSAMERIINPYIENLKRLGIDASLRIVDVSQYINRLQNFDFDITTVNLIQSLSPGNEQRDYWSSDAADTKGSRNYMGIRNPVVDHLVELLIKAPDREELVARTRALDRVLLHQHYVIPQWNLLYHRLVYWNKFSQPDIAPAYDLTFSTGLMTWWIDPGKAKRFNNKKNKQ